jgi:hypothetical protein
MALLLPEPQSNFNVTDLYYIHIYMQLNYIYSSKVPVYSYNIFTSHLVRECLKTGCFDVRKYIRLFAT